MSNPLVSIIIPTYNRAHLIGETLDSIIGQTYENWECIIVDDGSDDNTDEVLKKYCEKDSRIKYYYRTDEYLSGGNGARNYGFKLSKGKYINWFDSDDIMIKNKLLIQTEFLKKNENLDFVVGYSEYLGSNKLFSTNIIPKSKQDKILYYLNANYRFTTNSPLFLKASLIKTSLKFNENLSRGQEYEFYGKLVSVLNFGYVDCIMDKVRRGHKSINTMRNENFDYEILRPRISLYNFLSNKNLLSLSSNYFFFKIFRNTKYIDELNFNSKYLIAFKLFFLFERLITKILCQLKF